MRFGLANLAETLPRCPIPDDHIDPRRSALFMWKGRSRARFGTLRTCLHELVQVNFTNQNLTAREGSTSRPFPLARMVLASPWVTTSSRIRAFCTEAGRAARKFRCDLELFHLQYMLRKNLSTIHFVVEPYDRWAVVVPGQPVAHHAAVYQALDQRMDNINRV